MTAPERAAADQAAAEVRARENAARALEERQIRAASCIQRWYRMWRDRRKAAKAAAAAGGAGPTRRRAAAVTTAKGSGAPRRLRVWCWRSAALHELTGGVGATVTRGVVAALSGEAAAAALQQRTLGGGGGMGIITASTMWIRPLEHSMSAWRCAGVSMRLRNRPRSAGAPW